MTWKTLFPLTLLMVASGCQLPHEAEVDRMFVPFTGNNPGAAVMVVHDGKPVFLKCYGLADREKGIPVTPATNFRLASVTKQFTAMSAMILVEQGKLSFDTTLADIFPGFPDYGAGVTIRHLLTHTSGLQAYEDLMTSDYTGQIRDSEVLSLMASCNSTYFAPGSAYRYSNSGYSVLAMIVEKVSGESFAAFLRDVIFAPLKMDGTVAFEDGVSFVHDRAFGYAEENGTFVLSDQSTTSAVLGDGGVYSSLIDMFKWDQALYTETLVTAKTRETAFTPAVLDNGEKLSYGFGWNIGEHNGRRRVYHSGSTCGFRTAIHRYPESRFSVIVLTNRRAANVDSLAEALTDLFLAK